MIGVEYWLDRLTIASGGNIDRMPSLGTSSVLLLLRLRVMLLLLRFRILTIRRRRNYSLHFENFFLNSIVVLRFIVTPVRNWIIRLYTISGSIRGSIGSLIFDLSVFAAGADLGGECPWVFI